MLRNTGLGQPECFTEFCQLVKFLRLGHQELKYMCVFLPFWKLPYVETCFISLLKNAQALE